MIASKSSGINVARSSKHLVTIAAFTLIMACSKEAKHGRNEVPAVPVVAQAKTGDTGTSDKSQEEQKSPPVLIPDEATRSHDLSDPSLAVYLTPPSQNTIDVPRAKGIRAELAGKGIVPLLNSDFRMHSDAKVALGKMLFSDRILSGNMTVSCASCHVAWRGTGDGTSLMNDVGVKGLFSRIDHPASEYFLPRNSPPLFNRGHRAFQALFLDGRVEVAAGFPSGFKTPAGAALPEGLESVMAAQALFPLLSREEMLGDIKDNGLAAQFTTAPAIWGALMNRVRKNAEYMQMLRSAYPGVSDNQFGIQHVANAIAAFEDQGFRADNSAFDKFMKGDDQAMTTTAALGAQLFYGRAQCSTCHAGSLQSDQKYHAIAVPQIGVGKGHGATKREDYGRNGVTSVNGDRYKFKTPSLRNVYISGPWGHDGAFTVLRDYVRHYVSPAKNMVAWDSSQVVLRANAWPTGFFDAQLNQAVRQRVVDANEFPGVQLSDQDIEWLVEFMGTLTDRTYLERDVVAKRVPSGMLDFLGVYGLRSDWFEQLRVLPWL
jgi:cytochrome c peroxidase